MRELAAVLLAYAAVAAAVAAGARRSPPARPVPPPARAMLAVLAVAALTAAAALWPRFDGPILAGVCIVMAVSATASVFVLVAPVWPRLAWTLAVLAPVAAAILAAV